MIYIDDDFKCHAADDGTMTAVETDFFDGKCAAYIEGYRYARTEVDLTGGILSANQYGIRSAINNSSDFGANFGYDYDYSGTLLYVNKIGYERYGANSPIIPSGTRVKLYGVRV